MFEPFYVAPLKAKLASIWLVLVVFLSAVACLVTFEGTLHTLQFRSPGSTTYDYSYDFHWNRPHGPGNPEHYRQLYANNKRLDACDSAGDATLAFSIFAFMIFFLLAPMLLCRLAGLPCPTIRDVHQSLNYEIITTGVATFCFFVVLCSWGVCFTASRDVPQSDVVGKGFGLVLSCFFFQLISLVIMGWTKWHTEDWMVGIGANRSGARSDGVMFTEQAEFGDSGASAFSGTEQDENLQQFSYKTELPSETSETQTYTIAQEDNI